MQKVSLGVKVEVKLKNKIKYIASRKGISYADYVRFVITKELEQFEKHHGLIEDALLNQIEIGGIK